MTRALFVVVFVVLVCIQLSVFVYAVDTCEEESECVLDSDCPNDELCRAVECSLNFCNGEDGGTVCEEDEDCPLDEDCETLPRNACLTRVRYVWSVILAIVVFVFGPIGVIAIIVPWLYYINTAVNPGTTPKKMPVVIGTPAENSAQAEWTGTYRRV